jgi:DMSO/TMAO reductase YedYZ molybdopterin-dependent catalytic subunit
MAKARRYLHWPKPWRLLHALTIGLLPFLLLSGVALYYPPWHAFLIPWLNTIYWTHIVAGGLWLAIFLVPVVVPPRFGDRRTLSSLDWFPLLALGVGAAVTGALLVLPAVFNAFWRQSAFIGHGLLAAAVAAAVVAHASAKWMRLPVRRPRFIPERRQFLQVAGWAALAAVLWPAWTNDPLTMILGKPPKPGSFAAVNDAFVTYSAAGFIPNVPTDRFTLTVDGMVKEPLTLDWAGFVGLPQTERLRNFQCVTGWVVPNLRWQGVLLSDLLDRVEPTIAEPVVRLWSSDGVYTDTLTWREAHYNDVMLVWRMDGHPLPAERGGPVRLIVPEMYGYKSVKWVKRVELIDHVILGYWEVRGYPAEAYFGA